MESPWRGSLHVAVPFTWLNTRHAAEARLERLQCRGENIAGMGGGADFFGWTVLINTKIGPHDVSRHWQKIFNKILPKTPHPSHEV